MGQAMREFSQKKRLHKIIVDRMIAAGLDENQYENTVNGYQTQQALMGEMQRALQEVEEGNFTESGKKAEPKHYTVFGVDKGLMKRDYCVDIHRKLHAMSLVYMQGLKSLEVKELNWELQNIANAFGDLLFNELGIESNELDAATEYLGLEKSDKEYQKLCEEYTAAIGNLKLGAKE